jgi:Prohead core protein serine protease
MARNTYLREHLSFTQARVVLESEEAADGSGKTLYMKGICIEGGVRNANERVYPVHEITKAVETINEQIKTGHSVLGEVDHPDDLKINLDRVSHMIENMWMDGPCGYGKLKILPTPMGGLVKTMLDSGVKLGVSSRGSGNVNDANGHVSDFEIVTVDVVAQPSAPNAYPTAIYEGLLNHKGGQRLLDMYKDPAKSNKAQRYVQNEVIRLIRGLKIEGK